MVVILDEELRKEIEELKERLKELENSENEEEYDQMLDECYGTFKIGQLEFYPSRILSELDPIAYNCGLAEFNDEEIGKLTEEIEEKEEELKGV